MPPYDYHCPANGRVVEVRHGVDDRLKSSDEICLDLAQKVGA
jgi:hypothetical protein